jgi:urea transport system ATP-binding protein
MSETARGADSDLLYLAGVNKTFDGFKAINNLSISLAKGEMRAVIGPNGAGKSTMMDIITGKTKPDTGRVVFGASTDLTKMDEPSIAQLGIGRKFQKPTTFESHSVWNNLLLALAGNRSPWFTLGARKTKAEADKIEELLLVDEPVAGMTDAETEQTAHLLRDINRTRSVVVVEHDMTFVRALGVKVTVLHEGSVLSEGSLDQVSADPKVIDVYLGR